ncbi:MAG: glycosyltransferase family 39 protein [Caldilineaceae bacterium]
MLLLLVAAAWLRFWRLDALPPGLFYDEAFNGLDARQLLSGDGLPLYFPANNGREPLYIYLQAISVFLFGPTAYALRLVSALAGAVTVLAVYDLARSMLLPAETRITAIHEGARRNTKKSSHFSALRVSSCAVVDQRDPENSPAEHTNEDATLGHWIALLAAAGIAVSFWHLSLSRLAFRVILLPLLSSVAFAAFWRGWRGDGQRAFLWAGAALAATLYTYTAARLLPLVLIAFVLVEAVIDGVRLRHTRTALLDLYRPRLRGLALMALTALIFLLPLLWTFAQQPWLFSGRTGQVSIFTIAQADMPGTVLQRFGHNLQVTLRSFYDTGDQNLRHNLPGRSVNDAILAVLFTVGVGVAVLGVLKSTHHRFILIWLAVMLTPTIFSNLAPHAAQRRALPPLALLYGVGGGWFLGWARNRAVLHRGDGAAVARCARQRRHHSLRLLRPLGGAAPHWVHSSIWIATSPPKPWPPGAPMTAIRLRFSCRRRSTRRRRCSTSPARCRQDNFDAADLNTDVRSIVAIPSRTTHRPRSCCTNRTASPWRPGASRGPQAGWLRSPPVGCRRNGLSWRGQSCTKPICPSRARSRIHSRSTFRMGCGW